MTVDAAFPSHPDLPPQQQQPTPPEPSSAANSETLIFGKYKSMEEAERGLYETATSAAALKEMNDRLVEQNRQLADIATRQLQQPSVPETDPLAELQKWAVPVEPIRKAIQQEAKRIANETLHEQLGPLQESVRARQRIEQRLPGFGTREGQINSFMAQNPQLQNLYQQRFQKDPEWAMEWADTLYQSSTAARQRGSGSAASPSTEATLPQNGAAASRSQPPPDPAAEVANLMKLYDQTGNEDYREKAWRMRLRGLVSDEHLGLNQGGRAS
jgi:hypothetical protein